MKPENIFLLRHGQSTGNANKKVYKDTPDYALPLTELGHTQAIIAGEELFEKMNDVYPPIQFYVSPFWRARQTFLGVLQGFSNISSVKTYSYYEDPRLREQEWGQNMESREGYKDKIEEYRDGYGHFYYRFRDGGESCADVFDRVSDFMNTLHRDFEKNDYPKNTIIITHGMTIRLFLMRWFHCSVEEFESWGNLLNCQHLHLKLQTDTNKYKLMTPLKLHKLRHNFQFNWEKNSNFNMKINTKFKLPVIDQVT